VASKNLELVKSRPRVVVVGAGFGGLSVVRELRKADVDVLVLDRNNYHGFWPLLYQVATGILETQEIAYPVRSVLRKQKNVDFRMAEVQGVDFRAREVLTDGGAYPYDYLVLAGGSTTNFFGNDAIADHAFGLKSVDDADRLRNHILSAFEAAARAKNEATRDALLTFVVVGGGPTGVEISGQLSILINRTLPREFPSLDLSRARVVLVNAGDGVLESFPDKLRDDARRRLEEMGVELRLGETVESVEHGVVTFKDGSQLGSTTVIWAAGVRAADLAELIDVPRNRGNRVEVTPELHLADRPEVFVIGDMSYLEGYEATGGGAYPGVAQVAIQMGKQAARNIVAAETGREPGTFKYFDKGQMAIIGRRSAVVDGFGMKMRGTLAWFAWLGLHLLYLRGARNRLVVMLDWFAAGVSPSRGAGVITRREAQDRIVELQQRTADDERKAA
jgi:NADH dehydrogenase